MTENFRRKHNNIGYIEESSYGCVCVKMEHASMKYMAHTGDPRGMVLSLELSTDAVCDWYSVHNLMSSCNQINNHYSKNILFIGLA